MMNIPIPRLRACDIARLWSYVNKKVDGVCWPWMAASTRQGYGIFGVCGRLFTVTRLIYALTYKQDPGKLYVLHTCDNPRCCNPSHLFLGTKKDNTIDMDKKGRRVKALGEKNGQSKLTVKDIITIRKSRKFVKELAEEYAVSDTLISLIQLGKIWKLAGGPVRVKQPYLTNKQISAIRKSKCLQKEIALQYGITQAHVSNIKHGRRGR